MCHWSLGHLTNECEKRYSSLSTGASENKFVEAASEYLGFVGRVYEQAYRKITRLQKHRYATSIGHTGTVQQ